MKKPTKKESKPMKLEVKKINTKQYKTREEYEQAHKTEDKKKVGVRKWVTRKESTAHKKPTKTEEKTTKQMRKVSWRDLKLNDELVQKMNVFVGRPKIFKSPEYMQELFNNYLLSCMKKTKKAELVPVKTEDKPEKDELLALLDEEIQSSKWDSNKITNSLISNYEIVEDIERKKTPTKWGFCSFCGGISYQTFDNYKNDEKFLETITQIENTLETIWTSQAAEWKINSRTAEFVLNTRYNRIPKSKVEETQKTAPIEESEFIQN